MNGRDVRPQPGQREPCAGERYRRHLGSRHLDVGPGTGYCIQKAGPPAGTEITILDPNPHYSSRVATARVNGTGDRHAGAPAAQRRRGGCHLRPHMCRGQIDVGHHGHRFETPQDVRRGVRMRDRDVPHANRQDALGRFALGWEKPTDGRVGAPSSVISGMGVTKPRSAKRVDQEAKYPCGGPATSRIGAVHVRCVVRGRGADPRSP